MIKIVLTARRILLCFILVIVFACSPESTRVTEDFTLDWKFKLTPDDASGIDIDDDSWRPLDLPHDWSIEGKFDSLAAAGVGGGALPGGTGWYRKKFDVSENDLNKKVWVQFDGVYWNSEVWINGKKLGHRPNGYIGFRYDLTSHLHEGENVIAVKVDNSKQPNSRWYSGSGIYRNVYLVKTQPVYIDQWGTFVVVPNISNETAEIEIHTDVRNEFDSDAKVELETIVLDSAGNHLEKTRSRMLISVDSIVTFSQSLNVNRPERWSIERPYLYTIESKVFYDGTLSDTYTTTIGLRSFSFDSTKGFFLNEKTVKIKGVCLHHDLGCLGTAVNIRAIERQLEIMKAMGVNAIRTSHNPPAPELLDLCDKMGFLVMDEMFDMWKKKKSDFDYSQYWDEWHTRDLEDFIRRDRNHPSVIMWSIGNEIGEQWDSTGTAIAIELANTVRKLDSSRPITTGNNEARPFNSIIKSGAVDVIGYNYNHNDYAAFHDRYPGKKFIATETTSALATRGHYDMPSDSIRRWPISWDRIFTQGNADNTVSAYDNVSTPWGSTHEETWKVMRKHDHLSGMFIWTGFDYLGEPTPYIWPSRSSYFGVVDLAGFPKDTYYMYQSEWTSTPVLHLFPHWNWSPGQDVDMWAYFNNADEVELFVNGKSQGIKRKGVDDLHVQWRVRFEEGTVRAVSRKAGKEVLIREVVTADRPSRIILEPDRTVIMADGKDLSFVTIKVLDDRGKPVPIANDLIQLYVEGEGSIAGVDNGDPTSHTSFQAQEIKLFNGLALVVLRSGFKRGDLKLTASGKNLGSTTTIITIK
jgi:beta-galactosidase